jgi:Shikimate 5-dehydrogenase
MKKFAVIGSPISHSLSPQIHTIFAEQNNVQIRNEAIEVEEKDFATKGRLFIQRWITRV